MTESGRSRSTAVGHSVSSRAAEPSAQTCDPAILGENFERFDFVIDSAPEVTSLPVDRHEDLVQMPTPSRIRPKIDAVLCDIRSEQGAKPMPPEADRLVADIDATLEQ